MQRNFLARITQKGVTAMNFYERYRECCEIKGIKPSSQETADILGCARSNISAMGRNNTTPRGNIVANAAKMLNVSSDYLLGIIDTPEPIFDEHNEEEKQLLSMFRELNEDGKNAVIAMINGLSSNESYK